LPNVLSGWQSTRRRSMSTKTVSKQTPRKCLDCEHEFDGLAIHKEHYVESGSVLARTVFDRALVDCPNCGSHRVVARDA
jgi:DNA-directed RNA polymerase subunit RPC12/RpoP